MVLRKQKSRKQQAAEYLKVKTLTKTASGAKKAAKDMAVYKVAEKTPGVRRIPVVLGAAVAAIGGLVAFKAVRGRHGGEATA